MGDFLKCVWSSFCFLEIFILNCVCLFVCAVCMRISLGIQGGQRQIPLELELQVAYKLSDVGDGDQTWILWKSSKHPNHWAISPLPRNLPVLQVADQYLLLLCMVLLGFKVLHRAKQVLCYITSKASRSSEHKSKLRSPVQTFHEPWSTMALPSCALDTKC